MENDIENPTKMTVALDFTACITMFLILLIKSLSREIQLLLFRGIQCLCSSIYCGSIIINNKPVKFLTLVILSFAKLLTLILFETALAVMLAIWGSLVKRDWKYLIGRD